MRYLVTESIAYTVEADSVEEAIAHVIADEKRDAHCFYAVTERSAEQLPTPATD